MHARNGLNETEDDQDDEQTKLIEIQLNGLQNDDTCTKWTNETEDDQGDQQTK